MAHQFPCLSVHGPDVAARATVIVNVGVAHRQKTDDFSVAGWTLRDYRHSDNRRKIRPSSERTPRRRFSMAKRCAHSSQDRYAKLLAWANSRTRAAPHFGQGVTGRPPSSLGLGMFNLSGRFCVPQGACQLSCQGTNNLRAAVTVAIYKTETGASFENSPYGSGEFRNERPNAETSTPSNTRPASGAYREDGSHTPGNRSGSGVLRSRFHASSDSGWL